ncbi:MAG: chorismate mutase, partial [Candidatus Lokiarchaeota archaeon]|nr:chorismate mutase [Candidatus Lokiarchaeota archaeon]
MNEMDNLKKELRELREDINKIDDDLVDLLNKRGISVIKIGDLKNKLKLKVLQPQREKEIIERLKDKSTIFKNSSIEAIWKEIMSASKLIQGLKNRVGYLGPNGTFTHQAALEYFPKAGSEFITSNSS